MLYRRLSAARGPTIRTVIANNYPLYLATANGSSYTLSSSMPTTILRIGVNRASTLKVNLQNPGAGAGLGTKVGGNCYGRPTPNPGANGANGCAGFFWTAELSRTTINTGIITLGATGRGGGNPGGQNGCYGGSRPNTHGGRGGLDPTGGNSYGGPGGNLAGNTTVNFSSNPFVFPSNGAGGGGGSPVYNRPGVSGVLVPFQGNTGNIGSISGGQIVPGLSGTGGASGFATGYNRTAGTSVNARANVAAITIGTIILPSAGTPRDAPVHGVSLFTTNLYGQGGLFGLPANSTYAGTALTVNHGSNGAFMVSTVRSTFRF